MPRQTGFFSETMITERHASAVEAFLAMHEVSPKSVDLIGFHGQTVLHRPAERLTVQIGDGAALARRLGIRVASDFRAEDVAAGGQGAPLVPVYHRALVARDGLEGPVVIVNIGGVANITYVAEGSDPIACDTGPGNALLDDLMLARTGQPFDRDGATAARGRIDDTALAHLMDHPYFAEPAPKSLDRNAFSRAPVERLATEDAAATLVAFTAETIAAALRHLPAIPKRAIVCGGGGRNPTLMRELGRRLPCPLDTADSLGWSVEAMEAQAFAYLAVRQAKSLPITFPGTTGVPVPLAGGRLSLP
jgi:anhydro-N-acetylmuramic acid kinase